MQHIFASSVTLRITLSLLFPLFILVLTPMSADARVDGEIYAKSHGDLSGSTGKMDYQGYTYKVVKIGTQWWMAENLRATRYNDGTEIPHVMADKEWKRLKKTKSGAWCNHNNDPAYGIETGRLYNWYAVNTGKLAPPNWHVPSKEDWLTLVKNLGIINDIIYGPLAEYNIMSSTSVKDVKLNKEELRAFIKKYTGNIKDDLKRFAETGISNILIDNPLTYYLLNNKSTNDVQLKSLSDAQIRNTISKIYTDRYRWFSIDEIATYNKNAINKDHWYYSITMREDKIVSMDEWFMLTKNMIALKNSMIFRLIQNTDRYGNIKTSKNNIALLTLSEEVRGSEGFNISELSILPGGYRTNFTILWIDLERLKISRFWSSSKASKKNYSIVISPGSLNELLNPSERFLKSAKNTREFMGLKTNGANIRCVLNQD